MERIISYQKWTAILSFDFRLVLAETTIKAISLNKPVKTINNQQSWTTTTMVTIEHSLEGRLVGLHVVFTLLSLHIYNRITARKNAQFQK